MKTQQNELFEISEQTISLSNKLISENQNNDKAFIFENNKNDHEIEYIKLKYMCNILQRDYQNYGK